MERGYSLTTPSDKEFNLEWIVDAPRELVWRAYTDPNLISQWWGRNNSTVTVEKMDMRPGGEWRFVSRGEDGRQDVHYGRFSEIVFNDHIVETFEWEENPGHGSVDTIMFEDEDGKTKVRIKSVFQSTEDRDVMLQLDMEAEMANSIDRLRKLINNLREENFGPSNLSEHQGLQAQ